MNSSSSFVESIPPSPCAEDIVAQRNVDMLFDRNQETSSWEPPSPPDVLGELLDSRHMLPIFLPSDPRFLGAVPAKRFQGSEPLGLTPGRRSASRARPPMSWRLQSKKLREVEIRTLQWVDGTPSTARWYRSMDVEDEYEEKPPPYSPEESDSAIGSPVAELRVATHFTPLTRSRSMARSKGRISSVNSPMESPHIRIPSAPNP